MVRDISCEEVWTCERVFQCFEQMQEKGMKLTKEYADEYDKELYGSAIDLFGSWMDAKNSFKTRNKEQSSTENMKLIIFNKIIEMEEESNIKYIKNDSINEEFIEYAKNKNPFLKDLILAAFTSYSESIEEYKKYSYMIGANIDESTMLLEMMKILKNEAKINEGVIARKYSYIYKIISKKYGNMSSCMDQMINFLQLKLEDV